MPHPSHSLQKRHTAMDKRCVEENLRLADEYQRIMRAFNHLQTKYRHFKAADLARFAKVSWEGMMGWGKACCWVGCMTLVAVCFCATARHCSNQSLTWG